MLVKASESTSRKYTTAACVFCKRRKVRCDNKQPKCSNCNFYGVECAYGEDRRRTSSTLKTITALTERVQGLEEQLKKAKTDHQHDEQTAVQSSGLESSIAQPLPSNLVSPMTSSDVTSLPALDQRVDINDVENDLFSWTDLASLSPTSAGQSTFAWHMPLSEDYWRQAMGQQLSAVLENQEISPAAASTIDSDPSLMEPEQILGSQTKSYELAAGPSHPKVKNVDTDLSDDELAHRLATTSGCHKVDDDGSRRYYGPTSNLRMVNDGLLSLYQPATSAARGGGEKTIHQAGLAWEGDEEFESHLTKLYFTWHNPWIREVDETVYMRERQAWLSGLETTLYSPALQTAILAFGAMYSDHEHPAIKGQVTEFFNARAKIYVDVEMDSPSLATAQAVLLLAAYESSHCRDSRAWLYIGISVQIVTDLGLHVDMPREAHVADAETDIESIERVRNQLFWAVFISDCFHGSYSGRPSLMSNMKFRVPPPQRLPYTAWQPYVDHDGQIATLDQPDTTSLCDIPAKVTQFTTKLSRILESIYTPTPRSTNEVRDFVLAMCNDLGEWISSFPPQLQISLSDRESSPPPLPFAYLLYLHYHEAIIFLHRPFLADASPFASSPANLSAGQMCSSSAGQICLLLEAYQALYALQYINCSAVRIAIMAGTIHAYDSCVYSGSRGKEAKTYFLSAVRILGELSKTFHSATRGLEIITALRSDWQAQRFKRGNVKRKRSSQAS